MQHNDSANPLNSFIFSHWQCREDFSVSVFDNNAKTVTQRDPIAQTDLARPLQLGLSLIKVLYQHSLPEEHQSPLYT